MKRALGLHFPFLSTDRLRERDEGGRRSVRETPMATVAPRGQALRVVHPNRTARNLGVRGGQTLADARARVPELVTCEDDPIADRRRLESLAARAMDFSPTVHIEGGDTLIVDVTGCARLFHGEPNLLRQAVEAFFAEGFDVRSAIADTPGAAWALAHAHPEPAVIAEADQTAAELVPLPVWSLRIDPKTVDALSGVGVHTVGSLLHLPRSSLASRFGDGLLERIDQALGDQPEVLTPYRPVCALSHRLPFGSTTDRIDVLTEAITRALERFCDDLARRVAGVRQVFVTFHCPDVITDEGSQPRIVTLAVELSQPTRSAKHLRSLLLVRLDALRLPAPADALTVWARAIEPLDDWQRELFDIDAADVRAVGRLLDRLATRLGASAVVRAEAVSDHQPERAFRYVSLAGDGRVDAASARSGDLRESATNRDRDSPATRKKLRSLTVAALIDNTSSRGLRGAVRGTPLPNGRGSEKHGRGSVQRVRSRGSILDSPPRIQDAVAGESEDTETATAEDYSIGLRPLRLSPRPVEIGVTAIVPDGPPIALRFSGSSQTASVRVGPERIETGWWRGPHVRRDYYRITTQSGHRAWIFRDRDTGRWFLHGWFD